MTSHQRLKLCARPDPVSPVLIGTHTARAAMPNETLSVALDGEEHGIDFLRLQETRRYAPPTRIASALRFIEDVASLRGVVAPTADLRQPMGCDSTDRRIGMGGVSHGGVQRMPIQTDVEALVGSAEAGLVDAAPR